MSKPVDLVQGTLDLLTLKVVALQPLNGWAIGKRLKQLSGDTLQMSDDRFTPHCTNWSRWAGWAPSGRLPIPAGEPSSIR
jgi:hypothetical protein